MKALTLAIALILSCPAFGQVTRTPTRTTKARAEAKASVPRAVPKPASRTVEYHSNELVRISVRLRYTTILIFPSEETVSEVSCGDRDYWVIDVDKNLVHIKPAREGGATNMNVVTVGGNVYSFLLSEQSVGDELPDLRIVVEPKDPAMRARAEGGEKRLKPVKDDTEARLFREQIEVATKETAGLRDRLSVLRKEFDHYPEELRFPYDMKRGKSPFRVQAMFHDSRFTYIRVQPGVAVAVYEVVDKKSSLVEVEYRSGLYVVKKVLDHGYLILGKHYELFARREGE